MSDTKSTPDWSKDWQALQSQYWSAWSDATRQAQAQTQGQNPEAAVPWQQGLEQWSRMFGDSGKQNETAERVMASAKGYVALMQSMLATATGKNADVGPLQAWTEAMRGGFNLPDLDAALRNNPLAAMLRSIPGQGAQSFEQLSASFAPFLAQMKQDGMSWLQTPAFGYAREQQEHRQKAVVAFVEFQEAIKQYNALILKSSQRSFAIFEDKLAARSEPGRQIDSMRGLYDLWVDAAEEAYAEIALSEEFRKVYGSVVNAQMRVRSHVQQEVERIGTDLGMPTRTELNSVHKRLHELRRAGKASGGQDLAALQSEVVQLRAEVAALEKPQASAPKRTVPAKKKAVKTSKQKR